MIVIIKYFYNFFLNQFSKVIIWAISIIKWDIEIIYNIISIRIINSKKIGIHFVLIINNIIIIIRHKMSRIILIIIPIF